MKKRKYKKPSKKMQSNKASRQSSRIQSGVPRDSSRSSVGSMVTFGQHENMDLVVNDVEDHERILESHEADSDLDKTELLLRS